MSKAELKREGFRSVQFAIILLAGIVLIGIIGFIFFENYSLLDAIYMTIITMSTVGYGEVEPLSNEGQIFTTFLIIFSFGIFAYAITTLTRYIVDGIFRHYFMDAKIKNRISKLKNHVIVCGYGRNGKQAMEELSMHQAEAIIIDRKEAIIDLLREMPNVLYIQGDATSDQTLENASIQNAKAIITALPNDADNLFVVLSAREINPNLRIISRASDAETVKKLKRAGATNVIMPDRIGGQRMAKLVAQPDVVEFLDHIMLQTPDEVYIDELSCVNMDSEVADKTIGEWAIRQNTGANIIGLKTKENKFIVNPSPNEKLSSNDQLFVLGTYEQIERLKHALMGKE